jgi:hypothetical protein
MQHINKTLKFDFQNRIDSEFFVSTGVLTVTRRMVFCFGLEEWVSIAPWKKKMTRKCSAADRGSRTHAAAPGPGVRHWQAASESGSGTVTAAGA